MEQLQAFNHSYQFLAYTDCSNMPETHTSEKRAIYCVPVVSSESFWDKVLNIYGNIFYATCTHYSRTSGIKYRLLILVRIHKSLLEYVGMVLAKTIAVADLVLFSILPR